eukprot:scaffold203153_cov49-Prasinocladus_malaysianus.AAC.1
MSLSCIGRMPPYCQQLGIEIQTARRHRRVRIKPGVLGVRTATLEANRKSNTNAYVRLGMQHVAHLASSGEWWPKACGCCHLSHMRSPDYVSQRCKINRQAITVEPLFARSYRKETGRERFLAGGEIAPQGRFPYMVSLRDPQGYHFCAGVLVDQAVVLTAAHCVDPNNRYAHPKPTVNANRWCTNCVDEPGVQVAETDRQYIHPNWNSDVEQGNDIAILILDRVVDAPLAKIFPVTDTDDFFNFMKLWITGWGLSGLSTLPAYLRQAE